VPSENRKRRTTFDRGCAIWLWLKTVQRPDAVVGWSVYHVAVSTRGPNAGGPEMSHASALKNKRVMYEQHTPFTSAVVVDVLPHAFIALSSCRVALIRVYRSQDVRRTQKLLYGSDSFFIFLSIVQINSIFRLVLFIPSVIFPCKRACRGEYVNRYYSSTYLFLWAKKNVEYSFSKRYYIID
jgi:hypothetical protein